MLLALFVILLILWLAGFFAFHVAGGLIHLLLVVAAIVLVYHFMTGRRVGVARQMGHYSAGFTLDTYGHLMEDLPRRQVEFIDELVFPEGWKVALKLHLFGAPQGATGCIPVLPSEEPKPVENTAASSAVQSDVAGFLVEAAGIEPASADPGDSLKPLEDKDSRDAG